MAAHQPHARDSSISSRGSDSRRSSVSSVRDIFSDDYALEPIDLSLDLSLDNVENHDENPFHDHAGIPLYPTVPQRQTSAVRPSSIFKGAAGNLEAQNSRLNRTLSVSSSQSLPRSESPYNGPTTPSHPYAMYPQITRASSVASQSTFRPQERPFVHTGGPEHPYTLYPQNTVVDEDEDIGTQPIPLGFAARGYAPSREDPSTEVGDIVLSDGHIEQLPPYTRFADNIVAKGDMGNIDGARNNNTANTTEIDTIRSERVQLISADEPASSAEDNAAESEPLISSSQQAWREKLRRKVCGGIALWLLIVIATFVIFAGVLGGLIGGIVGRRQGATEARASTIEAVDLTISAMAAKATTTIWLDAYPVKLDPNMSTVPLGRYSIPFGRTEGIDLCVQDPMWRLSWGCLDIAYLGMQIGQDPTTQEPTVQFDDYSVDTTQFLYGPQPPDFNGSTIAMAPHNDEDNQELGVAMFFYQEFNKLNILPSYVFDQVPGLSISARDIFERGNTWDKTPLKQGDQPWFCFWNNTISEFWIFLEKSSTPSSNSTSTNMSTSYSTTMSTSTTMQNQPVSTTGAAPQMSATPYGAPPQVKYHHKGAWPNGYSPAHHKRSYTAAYLPQYPRLIKMVEKRRGDSNVKPYCQKMRVLNNWDIVPQEGVEIVTINELDFKDVPIYADATNGTKRMGRRDTTAQLQSNCVCAWMSDKR